MDELFDNLMDWCEFVDNKIVLMIAGVDSATNKFLIGFLKCFYTTIILLRKN